MTTVNLPRSGGKEAAGTSGIVIFSKSRSQIAFLPHNTLSFMSYILFFIVRFSFSNVQGSHRPWATRFVACELLSMLNLIAQVGPRCDDDNDDDIYIMVKCLFVCMFVTKNHHFLL